MKKLEIGQQVQIKDGSYMTTIENGEVKHRSKLIPIIGHCKDVFEILDLNGVYPAIKDCDHSGNVLTAAIKNLSNNEIWYCNSEISLKPIEMILNRWYYSDKHKDFLYFYTGKSNTYGFAYGKYYNDLSGCDSLCGDEVRATDEEVKEALVKEAKIRGFSKGMKARCLSTGDFETITEDFFKLNTKGDLMIKSDSKHSKYTFIFSDGEFAELKEKEPTIVELISAELERISKMDYCSNIEMESQIGCFHSFGGAETTATIYMNCPFGIESIYKIALHREAKQVTLDFLRTIK